MLTKIINLLAKILVVVIPITFIKVIFGIFYWRMSHFTEEDLQWINMPSETVTFVSEGNDTMDVRIESKNVYERSSPFYFSTNTSDTFEASAGYNLNIESGNYQFNGCFYIIKTFDENPLIWGASLKRFFTKDCMPLEAVTQKINGREIKDCLVVNSINGEDGRLQKEDSVRIDKFIISKQYGLVYFRFNDGTEFFPKFRDRPEAPAVVETPKDPED